MQTGYFLFDKAFELGSEMKRTQKVYGFVDNRCIK